MQVCNVYCSSISEQEAELTNSEDTGKWMPFLFLVEDVARIKLASDDEDDLYFNCTTCYTHEGDSFIIDVDFISFSEIFKKVKEKQHG